MHRWAIGLVCKVLMLNFFVLGHSVEASNKEELCREMKQEFDKCFKEGDKCDKAEVYENVAAIVFDAYSKKGLMDEYEQLAKCYPDVIEGCIDIATYNNFYVGHCSKVDFKTNRTCTTSPCPGWSLTLFVRRACAQRWCYSGPAPHIRYTGATSGSTPATQLLSTATFVMILVTTFMGLLRLNNI